MRDGHNRRDTCRNRTRDSCAEPSAVLSINSDYEKFLSRSVCFRLKSSLCRYPGFQCLLDSWRAPDEDSVCVCACPSWRMSSAQTWRGCVASLFSCARARRVKSCRGSSLSRTHTLRQWALSHIHTMRLRRLGLGPRPWALGSHTLNQHFNPAWDSDSVPSRRSEELAAPRLHSISLSFPEI